MGVVDQKSNLSRAGASGRVKDPQIEASKQRALQKRQSELDAQKRVDVKRKLEQQTAKLREINLINKTQNTRTIQAANQALRKSKVPSREIGFFKPTAPLAKRPTTTPLNAFVPDAIPNNVFLDSSGNFNPIDTNVQKYVQTRVDKSGQNTPIQIQHNNPPPRIGRFPLSDYYAQLKGSGPLGIKGPPRGTGPANLGFKQPFVVRDIGNNWGVDRFTGQKLEGTGIEKAGQILRIGFNFLDELGGAVIGRQPSVYVSRAGADLFRMGMFLASAKGLGFLGKQNVLKRTNTHAQTEEQSLGSADALNINQKYKGSIYGPISGFYDPSLPGVSSNLQDVGENLKKYDPTSLMSQPGVRSLQLSINQKFDAGQIARYTSIDNLGRVRDVLSSAVPNNAKKFLDVKPRRYNITIDSELDLPSPNLLKSISPVADAVSKIAGAGIRFLSSKIPKINLGLPRGKGFNFPTIKAPFNAGGKGFGEGIGNIVADVTSGVASLGRKIGDVVQGIGDGLPRINIDVINNDKVGISKKEAIKQNLDAFGDVGIDRVNMIPYGKRDKAKYNDETEEALDFVPFRFVDMNDNYIVFRAILSGISDSFTPDYAEDKYVGRPDKVYVYTGTTRTISFTFDVYPKSAEEVPILWTKMNALAGQTYPDFRSGTMVAPFTKLTIGEMYTEMPGYISALTYTVQDNGTWETTFTKSPKYIQANCTFIPIMNDLPASDQALYSYPWLQRKKNYDTDKLVTAATNTAKTGKVDLLSSLASTPGAPKEQNALMKKRGKKVLAMAGIG